MNDKRVFDAPLKNPGEDLLGMRAYPARLAEFIGEIEPPFTIGIYGEWGSGKTSFVCFLEHFLKNNPSSKPFEFITFNAWPYRTSDELWRAMIITIAENLYEVAQHVPDADRPPNTRPLRWVSDFFQRPALRLGEDKPVESDERSYQTLLARLDATPYGTISKDSQHGLQLDSQETTLALLKAALAGMGALSPLLATLRTFLGSGVEVDLNAILRKEKNEAVRERIKSVKQFQQTLGDLFIQKAGKKRICVFVDDLDRCMPDAALDLLEAIKIFLGEAPCIFIVAADEHLIGQGLLLRFRELIGPDTPIHVQSLYAQKGQQYFEKIIQLRICIPARTPEQTYNFVAAHFPRWMPATDLIHAAIGENPRRLKQYCNWLTFQHLASSFVSEQLQPEPRAELEKLISLRSWNRGALLAVKSLASSPPNKYSELLQSIEISLSEPEPTTDLGNDSADLRYIARNSPPIRVLFSREPRFSNMRPGAVAQMAEIIDLQDAPLDQSATVVSSRDGAFNRLLHHLYTVGSISAAKILIEDLMFLRAFWTELPEIAAEFTHAAESPDFADEVRKIEARVIELLERRLDDLAPSEPLPVVGQVIVKLVENQLRVAAEKNATPEQRRASDELRGFFQGPTPGGVRMSLLLREELIAFAEIRDRLPAPEMSAAAGPVSDELRNQQIANTIIQKNLLQPGRAEAIHSALQLRIEIAKHFLALRRFAKLDLLERRWPDLAYWLRTDRAAAYIVLSRMEQGKPVDRTFSESSVRYAHLEKDDDLKRFLRLRPHLRDIPEKELNEFFKMSQTLAPSLPAIKTDNVEVPTPQISGQKVSPPTPERPPAVAMELAYQNITIKIAPANPPSRPDGTFSYDVTVTSSSIAADANDTHDVTGNISIQFSRWLEDIDGIERVPRAPEPGIVTRQYKASDFSFPSVSAKLIALGSRIYKELLPPPVRGFLDRVFAEKRPCRILWDLRDPKLQIIPWESLYFEPLRKSIGLTRSYSFLRYLGSSVTEIVAPILRPLRMLVVLPTPPDLPPLSTDAEADIIERTLASARESKQVSIKFLRGHEANLDDIQRTLRVFQPQLFHFVGHGVFEPSQQQGMLLLQNENNVQPVSSYDLATLLRDSNVKIALLNGCDTGRGSSNDSFNSVAGALVIAGVPAVVATTRVVEDQAALLFSQEFYRTFVEGFTLEAAVIEARKSLNNHGMNWSSYVLFTGEKKGLESLYFGDELRHER